MIHARLFKDSEWQLRELMTLRNITFLIIHD